LNFATLNLNLILLPVFTGHDYNATVLGWRGEAMNIWYDDLWADAKARYFHLPHSLSDVANFWQIIVALGILWAVYKSVRNLGSLVVKSNDARKIMGRASLNARQASDIRVILNAEPLTLAALVYMWTSLTVISALIAGFGVLLSALLVPAPFTLIAYFVGAYLFWRTGRELVERVSAFESVRVMDATDIGRYEAILRELRTQAAALTHIPILNWLARRSNLKAQREIEALIVAVKKKFDKDG
jgi:hypothetical protein